MAANLVAPVRSDPMILSAIAEKLKRRSKDDFRGRHFEASLILQAVCWYLRYPLSYRDIEELFLERGLAVDHVSVRGRGGNSAVSARRAECSSTWSPARA